ncbi:thioesterase domain-containing protein [Wukongibacter sp. M2B1]|uniref:thioesterase domain-containing protein n=1 Tax=Wukongibacter sp. M2B1 TaxID=3088895 RepID=UPI003D7B0117
MIEETAMIDINPRYHVKRKVITLRKRKTDTKKIFIIHDGTGRLDSCFLLSELIHNDFSIYGITLNDDIRFVPKKITIEDIAKKYIKEIKKIQPDGPYFLIGWCVGGNIAFQMASQLEIMGNQIGFCGLFDTLPPKYFSQIHSKDFSIESETDFICSFITNKELKDKLVDCNDVVKFWTIVRDELTEENFDKELFIKMDKVGLCLNIPNIENTLLYDMFYGINIMRTLHDARVFHIPENKLQATVHLFKAKEMSIDAIDEWSKYSNKAIKYEVDGDHYSMLGTHINSLSSKLNEVLQNILIDLNNN